MKILVITSENYQLHLLVAKSLKVIYKFAEQLCWLLLIISGWGSWRCSKIENTILSGQILSHNLPVSSQPSCEVTLPWQLSFRKLDRVVSSTLLFQTLNNCHWLCLQQRIQNYLRLLDINKTYLSDTCSIGVVDKLCDENWKKQYLLSLETVSVDDINTLVTSVSIDWRCGENCFI